MNHPNLKAFQKNLICFYDDWNNNKQLWGNSEILLISSPDSISNIFLTWLLGCTFPDAIAIFTPKEIHFICNKQKVSLLKTIGVPAYEAVGANLLIYPKEKDDDGYAIVRSILYKLMPLIVGHVGGDSCELCTVDVAYRLFEFVKLHKKGERFGKVKSKMKLVDSGEFRDRGKGTRGDWKKTDCCLQALSKGAEEKILLAPLKEMEGIQVGNGDEIVEADGLNDNEWVLV